MRSAAAAAAQYGCEMHSVNKDARNRVNDDHETLNAELTETREQ